MTTEDYKKIAPDLPKEPGVYRFYDKSDTVLYVGKAKNLKNRLSSYFGNKKHQSHKTKVLVKNADYIDYTVVETEQDALLLECTLIKKFQPRYNVMLKDGKTYAYICIKKERFPRIFFTRKVIKDGSLYFGPYTSKYRANILFDLIKKIFPIRTCTYNLSEENIEKGKFKVCLEYHIKNCMGPCEAKESEEKYNARVDQVKNVLRGHFKPVKEFIKSEMDWYVERLEFEKAQEIKEKLWVFEEYQSKSSVMSNSIEDLDVFAIRTEEDKAYVSYLKVVSGSLINSDTVEMEMNLNADEKSLLSLSIINLREKFNSIAPEVVVDLKIPSFDDTIKITIPQRGDKRKLLDLADKNLKYFILQQKKSEASKIRKQTPIERKLKTLRDDLNMSELPFHIECFDNSNIQGAFPVASCVVFRNTKPFKKDYRHYNIKTVEGPDDFASMEEVVYRRYRRLLDEEKGLPQLVIIDGGKGQLSSAMNSVRALGLQDRITVIGIAKKLEEIYFPDDPVPVYINKKSESLKIIQQARNEAHRFAITFHRQKRSQFFTKSELEDIPGIGKKTAQKLLKHFGSVKKVKEAATSELEEVVGNANTKKLRRYFDKKRKEQ